MKYIHKYTYPLIIILVSSALFITNYKPGTFLVGWDNLYPELNFKANLWRNLTSVWQEYRGLGVEDGLAHSANVLHTLFLLVLSSIIPQSLLRYIFQFTAHAIGGLGMYILIKHIGKKNGFPALLGALFYQLNLITVQMFYAPLEVFSTHFAALPWLFYTLFLVLEHPSRKRFLLLFLVNLASTPQGFVPTVFIAYGVGIASVILTRVIIHRSTWKTELKKSFLILLLIFAANSFWILPFLHAVKQQGPVIKSTKINQLSSEVIYENNKKRGGPVDLLLLRGFMLDTTENNRSGKLVYIMQSWKDHIYTPAVVAISLALAALACIGILHTIRKKGHEDRAMFEHYFLPLIVVCFIVLGTRVPILSSINNAIRTAFPLLDEAFRFPFTKFSLVYICAFSLFVVAGWEYIVQRLRYKRNLSRIIVIALLLWSAFPAFQGHFLYSELRLAIPDDYFKTISYMNTQDHSGRVMTLPQSSFWNWLYYSWGARGSGFLWYGINQPMLERPFDPWSNYNGQYFNELYYALEKEDPDLIKQVINKYDISYILIDGYSNQTDKIQNSESLQSFIETSSLDAEKHTFGKIIVYNLPLKKMVAVKRNLPAIQKSADTTSWDSAFSRTSGYYENVLRPDIVYPFGSLFTNKTQEEISFEATWDNNIIALLPHDPVVLPQTSPFTLVFPPADAKQQIVAAQITRDNNLLHIKPEAINVIVNGVSYRYSPYQDVTIPLSANNDQDVIINGDRINLKSGQYSFVYTQVPNTLLLSTVAGSSPLRFIMTPTKAASIIVPAGDISFGVQVPVISPIRSSPELLSLNTYELKTPCDEVVGDGSATATVGNEGITLSSKGTDTCLHQYLPGAYQNLGLVLQINTIKKSGLDLRLVVDGPEQETNIIDTKLNGGINKTIAIPPLSSYLYTDYGIHLRNTAPGDAVSTNTITSIKASYFPYDIIQNMRFEKDVVPTSWTVETPYTHPAVYYYEVAPVKQGMLYLSQSYNPGWQAYTLPSCETGIICAVKRAYPFIFGRRISEHVIMNSWANGWQLSDSGANEHIFIIFLPQYLEYAGFSIATVTLVFLAVFAFFPSKKKKHDSML